MSNVTRPGEAGPQCWLHVVICGERQATWHDRDICKRKDVNGSRLRYVVISGYRIGKSYGPPEEYGVVQAMQVLSEVPCVITEDYQEAEAIWLEHERWTRREGEIKEND